MPRTVTVEAWERWRIWRQAQASRQAWQHAKQSENWAKDLGEGERRAMQWALDKDNT